MYIDVFWFFLLKSAQHLSGPLYEFGSYNIFNILVLYLLFIQFLKPYTLIAVVLLRLFLQLFFFVYTRVAWHFMFIQFHQWRYAFRAIVLLSIISNTMSPCIAYIWKQGCRRGIDSFLACVWLQRHLSRTSGVRLLSSVTFEFWKYYKYANIVGRLLHRLNIEHLEDGRNFYANSFYLAILVWYTA